MIDRDEWDLFRYRIAEYLIENWSEPIETAMEIAAGLIELYANFMKKIREEAVS